MVEEVSFFDCVAFGRTAEVAAEYLAKGRQCLIQGRLKQERWEDKETGAKRTKVKVVIDTLKLIGGAGGGGGSSAGGVGQRAESGTTYTESYSSSDDEAMPF